MQNWVCANSAPAATLAASLSGCQPAGGSIGASAAPRKKRAWPATLRPEGSSPLSRRSRAMAVSVVESTSSLGLRLVAGLRVVAGEAQEVAHAAGGGAHELGLQRNPVAVAAGGLGDGLDAAARGPRRRDRGGEVRAGAGAVGDVDGIRQAGERLRLAQQVVRVARDRRRDLGGDDELPRAQQRFQARSRLPLRGGHRLVRRGLGAWARARPGGAVGGAAFVKYPRP